MPAYAPVWVLTIRAVSWRDPFVLVRRAVSLKIFRVVLLLVLSAAVSSLHFGCSPVAAAEQAVVAQASPEAEPEDEIEPAITTLFGERVLLFMENPHLVQGEPAKFLAHFSVLATGEPVRSGKAVLQIGATTLVANGPKRDGLFIPEGSFPASGDWPATLTITSEQAKETLDLGLVTVHESLQEAAVAAAAAAAASDEPPGHVPFLMEQQWEVGTLLAPAEPRQLTQRLVVPAQIVLAEGAAAVVSPPVSGRLLAPAHGPLVRSGDRVQQGQELGIVVPPVSADVAAQLNALALELELQSLRIDHEHAEASTQLSFATIEHARLAQLVPKGLATRQQLALAERDVALAASSEKHAQEARESLAALQQQQRAESVDEGLPQGALSFSLHAPISGVVLDGGWVVGESVEASEELLRIVDPDQLWVVGRVSEFDLSQLSESPAAQVTLPALPTQRIPVGADGADGAAVMGSEVELPSRTVSIRYALPASLGAVRAGMLADLEIAVDVVDAPVVIPFEAVVMEQGMPTAYVMLHGELFQRRDLTLGLRDGDFVEVRAGIDAGEHVATRGAATLRLAALSPASFGHGHAH
ncbi:MAG: cobalt-zinc-cadmium efflux system membrane fusion protein [Pseudohongiellaceae bacterium]